MAELTVNESGKRAGANALPRTEASPAEGWLTLLLHVLVLAITANSVVRIDQSARSNVLIPLAVGGLVLGCLAARTPALDAFSHVLAFVLGGWLSLLLSAIWIDGLRDTWHSRGHNVNVLGHNLIESQFHLRSEAMTDNELMVVIGITLWLVGYSSAWMLYRRHWLVASLVAPAGLILVSLRFEHQQAVTSIATFGIAALVMAARHQAFVRQVEWARMNMTSPVSVNRGFTLSGSVLAVFVLFAGWMIPIQAPSGMVNGVASQTQSWWQKASDQIDRLGKRSNSGTSTNDDFADFSDSFKIGQEFNPSNDKVATLSADKPFYLALRRYDVYNGTDWLSGVDKTFQLPGESDSAPATSVTFDAQQFVALSPNVNTDRQREAGAVTVLQNTGGLLFTIDTYTAASLRTIAVIGWLQIPEQQINIATADPTNLPTDVQELVRELKRAQFSPDANGNPQIIDTDQSDAIAQLRAQLKQYPVDTTLSFGANNQVMLTISGRVPNYDDIEAIYQNPPSRGATTYNVVGSESYATEDELRDAGGVYPDWITSRYLQESDTVTKETTDLAAKVITESGVTNDFDKAWAIQEYLKTTFGYQLNSQETPKGQDAVDYFLFGKKVGRCEEFATSMVVMLRSQGIPARLVSGFRSGDETDSLGDYVYRGTQAHTWVEVYFPQYGWVPFEPTPGQDAFDYDHSDQQTPVATAESPAPDEPTATALPNTPVASASPVPVTPVAKIENLPSSNWTHRLRNGVVLSVLLTLGGTFLILVVLIASWIWGLRGLKPGASLYARVQRIGRLWGVDPDPAMTPAEYADEFGHVVPRAGRAVQFVSTLYAAERYGGIDISNEASSGGRQAWHSVRTAVLSWRPWKRRKH